MTSRVVEDENRFRRSSFNPENISRAHREHKNTPPNPVDHSPVHSPRRGSVRQPRQSYNLPFYPHASEGVKLHLEDGRRLNLSKLMEVVDEIDNCWEWPELMRTRVGQVGGDDGYDGDGDEGAGDGGMDGDLDEGSGAEGIYHATPKRSKKEGTPSSSPEVGRNKKGPTQTGPSENVNEDDLPFETNDSIMDDDYSPMDSGNGDMEDSPPENEGGVGGGGATKVTRPKKTATKAPEKLVNLARTSYKNLPKKEKAEATEIADSMDDHGMVVCTHPSHLQMVFWDYHLLYLGNNSLV